MNPMRTLYLDLSSGISGDMFLGALLDLGADARQLERELRKLPLEGWHLHVARAQKCSLAGVKFDVHVTSEPLGEGHVHAHAQHQRHYDHPGRGHHHAHHEPEGRRSRRAGGGAGDAPAPAHGQPAGRTFADIRQLISGSALSDWVKQKSLAVFQRLAVAEGRLHGVAPEQVGFHEVGAVDSIVDIVGACVALELLGRPNLQASPVVEGTGWIDCAHGRFPVPAPATLAVLGARGIAISQTNEPHELVTPTGAALLAELVESFGPMREMRAEKLGFGLGSRELATRPNVLRVVLGEAAASAVPDGAPSHDWLTDTIAVLETNLDDISAELLGHFVEAALAAGALDVFHTPIQMKKNRPGVLVTVLCATAEADRFTEMMLRETTTFGVRRCTVERRKLAREFVTAATPFGEVPVKLGRLDGRVVQAAPEHEACRKLAAQAKVPLKEVYAAALRALPREG
jgi:hypothetical protein